MFVLSSILSLFDAITASSVMEIYEGQTFPLVKQYYIMTERYRFIESSTRSLSMNFPSRAKKDRYYSDKELHAKAYIDIFNNDAATVSQDYSDHINKLPDCILLQVFRRLHPLDFVHSLSLVCKRWNLLVQYNGLWKDVRVTASKQSLETGALRRFLTKVNNGIKRLSIDYSFGAQVSLITGALPKYMNTVTLLDMSGIEGFGEGITVDLWQKLIECFTNVETLNIARTNMLPLDGDVFALIPLFFGENSFRKIRRFICGSFYPFEIPEPPAQELFLSALWRWNRPLELLSFPRNVREYPGISKAPFAETLTVLHLSDVQEEDDFMVITELINLKELFLGGLLGIDHSLVGIKKLSNLVHLHFNGCGEDGGFTDSGFVSLFELPEADEKNIFPSKLKHLKLVDCYRLYERAAGALARNCLALESLNISGNCSIGESGLSTIVETLRELRFLNISNFGDEMPCSAIRNIEDESLPYLKYLRLHRTKIPEEVLRELQLRRKNLIISPRPDHILTFTVHNGSPQFDEQFTGNMNSLENDLLEQPGYCCMN
ncbi:hypothetical protein AB6A40_005035 [Gnathostoma spinigerum]|uniref:F-box domain-containing protein n=1 Tax=Gnathostoma spinigerum TaxID=75299 RepID=A0ABD6ELM9_9BILA